MKMKKVFKRPIYIILRNYSGGLIEYIEAHFEENDARLAAHKLIPLNSQNEYISIQSVNLKGEFVVKDDGQ